jgi:hypothetical protein
VLLKENIMSNSWRRLALIGAFGLSLVTAGSAVFAHDSDEYWSGYWKWYDGPYRNYYNRPHDLRYSESQPTLYYGHAPPNNRGVDPPYQRGEPPHIGNYTPIYGPGHYYGPAIAPYGAGPSRDTYAGVRYGWW